MKVGVSLFRTLFLFAFVASMSVAGFLPRVSHAQELAQGNSIGEIIVEGAQRIEKETIRSYMLVRSGDPMDRSRIDRSLKSLFATGLFADVKISRRGTALVVTVVENPIINRIAFEGNQRIENKDLELELSLRQREIYTRSKVQNDVARILDLYRRKGRFAAVVDPKVIQLEQNRIDLVFEIDEGPLSEIRKIRFVGNRAFDDSDLRDEIITKETRWFRFLTSDDNYDPDRMGFDKELLRRFYLNHGYADFKILSGVAELTPDRKNFFLTYTVDEGPRYRYGAIEIDNQFKKLTEAEIQSLINIKKGDWYSAKSLEKTVNTLTDGIGSKGYAFARVKPRIKRDSKESAIEIVFSIQEGEETFVELIEITGNLRTKDEVLRREMALVEGDPYSARNLEKSRKNIKNLDFFSKVEFKRDQYVIPDPQPYARSGSGRGPSADVFSGNVDPGAEKLGRDRTEVTIQLGKAPKETQFSKTIDEMPDKTPGLVQKGESYARNKTTVQVKVEEKSTGSLSLGAGYSTTDGALATIGIREKNLLGQGQDLKLSTNLSQKKTQVDLSFTEPYFLNRDLSAGFDIFRVISDNQSSSSYDSDLMGFALRTRYPVSEYLTQGWKLAFKASEVTNVDSAASIYIQAEEGKKSFAELTHTLFYDRLNSLRNPTDGYYMRVGNTLGGVGDATTFNTTLGAGRYFALDDQLTFSVRGAMGYVVGIGDDVGLLDRFFLGGDDLRGFSTSGVGPRDSLTDDALGGEWMYRGTTELIFPLGLPNEFAIQGRLFSDFGSVGKLASVSNGQDTNALRASVGFGLFWTSPAGPISIDFGFPILKESFDQTETFRLNFGTSF